MKSRLIIPKKTDLGKSSATLNNIGNIILVTHRILL